LILIHLLVAIWWDCWEHQLTSWLMSVELLVNAVYID